MTPCPASRTRVKRISPARVFLSRRMASIIASSDGPSRGIMVGSPARWSAVSCRPTTSAETNFIRAAMRSSTLIPMAMASPCASVRAKAEHFQTVPQQAIELLLGESQQVGVADHPVLDDFGQPQSHLAWRQCLQGLDVRQYQGRLLKAAHEILRPRGVHRRLAADRAVHLGEQGGG